jgi:hypothetical protein
MKKIYMLLTGCLFFISSCNEDKFFELERPPANPFNTVTEFERAPIGLYNRMFAIDSWNIPWVNISMVKINSGDDVSWAFNPEFGYLRNTKEFNRYSSRGFFGLYQVINSANDAIDFVASANGNPYPAISAEDKINNLDRILGELHFMRGYSYFLLATTFGHAYVPGSANSHRDIPLRIHLAKDANEAANPYMGTTEEIYAQIIADFTRAKELLPQKYIAGKMHPSYQAGRANKFAAAAMLARTYFQMGDHARSEAECNLIIDENNGEYDLSQDPIEAFNKSELTRGREVIMYIAYYDDAKTRVSPNHSSVFTHKFLDEPCPWSEAHMEASTLKRLNWMQDPRGDTTITEVARRDKRFTQLFAVREPYGVPTAEQIPGRYYEKREKLPFRTVFSNKYNRGPKAEFTNYPLLRLSEIYLTRSICRMKKGDKMGAAADLNVVRKRAWDEAKGGTFQATDPATITEQMIHDERLIEMFGEDDRINYLRGLKVDIGQGERGQGTVPYTDESFVWILPQGETDLNQNFK